MPKQYKFRNRVSCILREISVAEVFYASTKKNRLCPSFSIHILLGGDCFIVPNRQKRRTYPLCIDIRNGKRRLIPHPLCLHLRPFRNPLMRFANYPIISIARWITRPWFSATKTVLSNCLFEDRVFTHAVPFCVHGNIRWFCAL